MLIKNAGKTPRNVMRRNMVATNTQLHALQSLYIGGYDCPSTVVFKGGIYDTCKQTSIMQVNITCIRHNNFRNMRLMCESLLSKR